MDIGTLTAKYRPELMAEARADLEKNPPCANRVVRMMHRFGRHWHEVEIALLLAHPPGST